MHILGSGSGQESTVSRCIPPPAQENDSSIKCGCSGSGMMATMSSRSVREKAGDSHPSVERAFDA